MTERSPPSRAVPEPQASWRGTRGAPRQYAGDAVRQRGRAIPPSGTEVDITNIDWPRNAKPVLLIVEDDETFAGMLAELAPKQASTLSSRPVAERPCPGQEHQPAAITLDIGLPDMAGWVVLDVLKHELATRHIPVNVISGTSDDGRGRRMGAIHTEQTCRRGHPPVNVHGYRQLPETGITARAGR